MRQIIFCGLWLMLYLCTPITSAASVEWPNEPIGATTWADCPLNELTCGGKAYFSIGSNIISDATTLTIPTRSPTNVQNDHRPPFSNFGDGQFNISYPGGTTKIYNGFWWRLGSNFPGNANAIAKISFITSPWMIIVAYGPQGSTSFLLAVYLQFNPPGPDNCGLPHFAGDCPWAGSGAVILNTNCSVTQNVWYRVETAVQGSTTPSSNDGKIRLWLSTGNGAPQLCTSSDALNTPATTPFLEMVWTHTWNDTENTTAWDEYLDHYYISTGGTIGGSDTTAPATPSGVMVTMLAATMIFGGIYGHLTAKPLSQHRLLLGDHSADSATLRTVAVHGGAAGTEAVYRVALADREGRAADALLAAPAPAAASDAQAEARD